MILLCHILSWNAAVPPSRLKYFLSRFKQKWLPIAWTFLSSVRACRDKSKYFAKPSLTAWLIDKLIDNSNGRDCHYISAFTYKLGDIFSRLSVDRNTLDRVVLPEYFIHHISTHFPQRLQFNQICCSKLSLLSETLRKHSVFLINSC